MIISGQLFSIIRRIVVHSWVFPKFQRDFLSLSLKTFETRAAGPLNFNKCWSDALFSNLKAISTIPLNVLKDIRGLSLETGKDIGERKDLFSSYFLFLFLFVSIFLSESLIVKVQTDHGKRNIPYAPVSRMFE